MTVRFPVSLLEKKSIACTLFLLVSAYVFAVWVWSADTPTTSFNSDPRSRLSELIYGTAHKPYVQRALIPITTRALYSLVPASASGSLERSLLAMPKVQKETARLGWETDYLSEYIIALALAFLCLAGFAFAVRNLWQALYDTPPAITNSVPLLALLVLPTIFPTGPHYIYDFPALFLFTLGLTLLVQRRWALFYPVFVIGCVNKETMVLLALAYLLSRQGRRTSRTTLLHAGAQLLLFGIVKAAITAAFADNPGTAMELQIHSNIHILLMGYSLPTLLTIALIVSLIAYDWSSKHPVVRHGVCLLIPFGLLYLWSGVVTELRALYELVPILLLPILHTVFFSFLKIPYKLKDEG